VIPEPAIPELASFELGHKGFQAHCRAIVYSLFAQTLAPPSEALLGEAADGSLRSVIEAAVGGLRAGHRARCAAPLDAALAALEQDAADPGALLAEYTRLFGNGVVCPHYETEYVQTDAFRAVHVVAEVAAFYQAFGVRVAATAGERPDYIGMELAFMSFLASKQAWAAGHSEPRRVRQAREAQRQFLTDHLGRWARSFCRALAESAETSLHRALAPALDAFLVGEAEHLGARLAD
jgi:DMSO reductase family type II enzyme chaperone